MRMKSTKRTAILMWAVLAGASTLLCSGCIGSNNNRMVPGLTIMDATSGKVIAHIEDASLTEKGPWGPHDMETVIQGNVTDKTIRLIRDSDLKHTSEGNWCIREFDADGRQVATRSLPAVTFMHGLVNDYAFSPSFDRVAFCDDTSGISLLDLNSGDSRILLKDAVKNFAGIEWMKWVDDNTIALCVSSVDEGPYPGSIILLPMNGGEHRILYKHERLWEAALSPDMKYLAVTLMFMFPEPSQWILVDLANGKEQLIGTFPRDKAHIGNVTWSPDSKFIAYSRGMDIEMYLLEDAKCSSLKENPQAKAQVYDDLDAATTASKEGIPLNAKMMKDPEAESSQSLIYGIYFVDPGRLAYCSMENDEGPAQMEILDTKTGETLLSHTFHRVGHCQVFDDGKRIAIQARSKE